MYILYEQCVIYVYYADFEAPVKDVIYAQYEETQFFKWRLGGVIWPFWDSTLVADSGI